MNRQIKLGGMRIAMLKGASKIWKEQLDKFAAKIADMLREEELDTEETEYVLKQVKDQLITVNPLHKTTGQMTIFDYL